MSITLIKRKKKEKKNSNFFFRILHEINNTTRQIIHPSEEIKDSSDPPKSKYLERFANANYSVLNRNAPESESDEEYLLRTEGEKRLHMERTRSNREIARKIYCEPS